MQPFEQSSWTLVQAIKRRKSPLLERISKTFALALCVFFAFDAWKGDETVISGQVHGTERTEGVWVGLATGDRTLSHYQHAPFDDAFIAQERNEVDDWLFAPDGKFELRSGLEANANLILISKNRVPIVISVTPDASVQPLEVHLSRGMELEVLIHDSNGVPIPGATVSIRPSGKDYEIPTFAIPSWETGNDGTSHVAGLEPREYLLIVSGNEYAPIIVPHFVIPNANVHRLEVELVDGHYVSGKVTNENGSPLSNVGVRSSWTRSHAEVIESDGVMKVGRSDQFGWYFPQTQTSEDGTFRLGPFEIATDGSIWADSPEFGSSRVRDIYAPSDDLLLQLSREKVQGRVLEGETRKPIEAFSVVVYPPWGRGEDIDTSDGYFELSIAPLDSEDNAIVIDSEHYFPWIRPLYQGETGVYDLGTVMLEKERVLRGIVRDGETGTPMEGVTVGLNVDRYFDQSVRSGFLSSWFQEYRTKSSDKGEYLLNKLPRDADSLELYVVGHGRRHTDIPTDVEEFDIDLYFNGVLEGSLVLPEGRSVEGTVVLLSPPVNPQSIRTDNGVFRWEGLSPGKYTLRGESDAGMVESRTVVLEAGERLTGVELGVTPGWSAKGTIAGLKGNERVQISVKDSERRELISKWFGNGPYVIHGIPNEALITARTSTGRVWLRLFHNGNEEGEPIDFRFGNESQLRGFVLAGGEPVIGMPLFVVPKNLEHVAGFTRTTASGSYVIKGLSDGPHVVRTQTGYSIETVIDGETTSDIELPHNSVSGIVRSEQTRSPIGGGVVIINGLDIPVSRGPSVGIKMIGSDGTFSFVGLNTGDYEIEIVHPHAEKVSRRVKVEGPETIELLVQCANSQECNYGGSGPRRTVKTR